MTVLIDLTFAPMTFHNSCRIKTDTMTIFGKAKTVEVICDDCNGEIIEDQRNVDLQYKLQESSFLESMADALLAYYLDNYQYISGGWDVPEKYNKQNVTKWNVTELLDFTELYFSEFGDCSWIAKCPWDDLNHLCFDLSEDGVEVMVVPVIK